MIHRIVRMQFHKQHIDDFKGLFDQRKTKIKASAGCHGVKLLQDKNDPCIFFTFSLWESEQDLNNYRNSSFFADTWKLTKSMMESKAKAWSTSLINE